MRSDSATARPTTLGLPTELRLESPARSRPPRATRRRSGREQQHHDREQHQPAEDAGGSTRCHPPAGRPRRRRRRSGGAVRSAGPGPVEPGGCAGVVTPPLPRPARRISSTWLRRWCSGPPARRQRRLRTRGAWTPCPRAPLPSQRRSVTSSTDSRQLSKIVTQAAQQEHGAEDAERSHGQHDRQADDQQARRLCGHRGRRKSPGNNEARIEPAFRPRLS